MSQIAVEGERSELLSPEVIFGSFIFFSLNYYVYVYFFPFEHGVSAAPAVIKAIKDFAYLAFLLTMLPSARIKYTGKMQLLFVPFAAALLLVSLIHAPQTGLVPQLWENIKNTAIFVLSYCLIFVLPSETRDRMTKILFAMLVFASASQTLFSFAFAATGAKLWSDDLFAGLIANPNSFALMLNMATAVILIWLNRADIWTGTALILLLAIVAKAILGTSSGSQFAIFLFLIGYAALLNRANWKRSFIAAAVVGSVVAASHTDFQKTIYTFSNVSVAVSGKMVPSTVPVQETTQPVHPTNGSPPTERASEPEVSRSVRLRVDNVAQAFSLLKKGWTSRILGDFETNRFVPMDGQFWMLFFNGGALALLTFAIPSAFIYGSTLVYALRNPGDHQMIALHLMITAFGITCLASRIIAYFPFNFLFFAICGLAMTRISVRSSSR